MNLAETQLTVRRLLVLILGLTILYYSGQFVLIKGIQIYRAFLPKEKPPPASAFGILPQLKMPNIQIDGTPVYVLETESGGLPSFPDRLEVYPVPRPQENLLSEQQIKELAADLGFTSSFTKLSSSEFRWVDGQNRRTFRADAITKNFTLDSPLSNIASVITGVSSIIPADATIMTKGFIQAKSLMQTVDLNNISYETVPTQITLGTLKEEPTSNAKIQKVNVYRNVVKTVRNEEIKYKVLGPNPKNSLIAFYTTNEGSTFKFPIIEYTYWQADYDNGSAYYLAPISSVWSAIQSGSGIVTYLKLDSSDYYDSLKPLVLQEIAIRDVSIAYYEQSGLPQYLQPMYVFEGRFEAVPAQGKIAESGDIIIYYPAVRGDWTESN